MGKSREDRELEAWQLLLWSYRNELGLEQTHPDRSLEDQAPLDHDEKAWHTTEEGPPA